MLTLSGIVLTDAAPAEFLASVREMERAGVARAWTYDHLSWREPDRPWFAAIPMLAAAAATTERIRLGTLVATPNFRHPVPLAKEILTLDHLSGGRIDLGVGAGADSSDATVLGTARWSGRERSQRFAEWTQLLVTLLEHERVDFTGRHYSARDARMIPSCAQRPRVPLTMAAAGPRGMRLAARYAQTWVTYGDVHQAGTGGRSWLDAACRQSRELDTILTETRRDGHWLRRAVVIGVNNTAPFTPSGAYDDTLSRLAEAGFDEVCVHWPRRDGRGVPAGALEHVLARHLQSR